jgi:polysaccharide deacetylase family protein (PEP-CTERM system associated)
LLLTALRAVKDNRGVGMNAPDARMFTGESTVDSEHPEKEQWFECALPQQGVVNVLSFDVEDWYHSLDRDKKQWAGYEDRVVESTRRILEVLRAFDTRATFFVLKDVAERHPELVREISLGGHEIGSHGSSHEFVYNQTPEEFESDVAQSLRLLEEIIGEPVISYRAPYFSITKKSLWALPILKRLGIKYDSSIFPVVNYRYGIPDAPRAPYQTEGGPIEVPIATYPVGSTNFPCGGGVYFRAFPYRFMKRLYHNMNERGEKIVFYLHPWELDPDQPVKDDLERGVKMRHYFALHKTEGRLTFMIRDFRFGPIREVVKL